MGAKMSGLDGKQHALGWIIGYFLFTMPIRMALQTPLIYSLLHCIFGVSIAIGLMLIGGKE